MRSPPLSVATMSSPLPASIRSAPPPVAIQSSPSPPLDLVQPRPAVDLVVAGAAAQGVVARAAGDRVGVVAAVDAVVAAAAAQLVAPRAAGQHVRPAGAVVAVVARVRHQRALGAHPVALDLVVALAAVDPVGAAEPVDDVVAGLRGDRVVRRRADEEVGEVGALDVGRERRGGEECERERRGGDSEHPFMDNAVAVRSIRAWTTRRRVNRSGGSAKRRLASARDGLVGAIAEKPTPDSLSGAGG